MVANCDHLQKLKFSEALAFAFTEHGAIQAANVLATAQAVEMGIYVVRAFVRLPAYTHSGGRPPTLHISGPTRWQPQLDGLSDPLTGSGTLTASVSS